MITDSITGHNSRFCRGPENQTWAAFSRAIEGWQDAYAYDGTLYDYFSTHIDTNIHEYDMFVRIMDHLDPLRIQRMIDKLDSLFTSASG
tara:strand:+ start:256 stop:522 length:267 start_codon:yes stop_codon:yes gene_type:complete